MYTITVCLPNFGTKNYDIDTIYLNISINVFIA